jgi:DNA-binding SARP family transcriptional activator/predicted ATPase
VLRVHVLGPTEVVVDGEQRALGGAIPRAVIVLLALAQGRTVHDDVLFETAWAGHPPASVHHALNVYISTLRKAIAPGATIARTHQGFALSPTEGSGLRVDALELRDIADAAREAHARGDFAAAGELVARGLALWRGRPFADLPESAEWDVEAARLVAVHGELSQIRAECRVAAGDLSAIAELRAFADQEAYDEAAQMRLMRALYVAGRQQDALDVFGVFARRVRNDLGLEPSIAMIALERAILNHRLDAGDSRRPRRSQPVFGREALVEGVVSLLTQRTKVVSLVGMGGIGKTTAAIAVADEFARRGHHVNWISATELSSADVPSRIAEEITGLRNSDPYRIASDHDAPRLLVVDGFEGREDEAPYLDFLVGELSSVSILVTSRRPSRVAAEWIVQVPPLEPAVAEALFIELIERRATGALRDEETAATAAEICSRLGGIPLVLELAAARVGALSIGELADTLDVGSLAGRTTSSPSHRSMARVLDSTVALLTTNARRALEFAGVFRSPFSRADIAAVADLPEPRVEATLQELYDAGLILRGRTWGTVTHFVLLDPIRDYAAERLRIGGAAEIAKSRHLELIVDRIAELAEEASTAATQIQAFARFEDSRADLAAALEYAVAENRAGEAVDLVDEAMNFWRSLSASEGLAWIERVRALELEPQDRVRLLRATRTSLHNGGRLEEALEVSTELLASGNATLIDRLYDAALRGDSGDNTTAIEQYEAITLEAREQGDQAILIRAPAFLATAYLKIGDVEAALAYARAAGVAIEEFETGPLQRAYVRVHQAFAFIAVGDSRTAAELLREALQVFGVEDANGMPDALLLVADLAISHGDEARGLAIAATAEEVRARAGMVNPDAKDATLLPGARITPLIQGPAELTFSEAIAEAHAVLDDILSE